MEFSESKRRHFPPYSDTSFQSVYESDGERSYGTLRTNSVVEGLLIHTPITSSLGIDRPGRTGGGI